MKHNLTVMFIGLKITLFGTAFKAPNGKLTRPLSLSAASAFAVDNAFLQRSLVWHAGKENLGRSIIFLSFFTLSLLERFVRERQG